MSLYNSIMGVNPYGPGLLFLLGFDPRAIPRLRDCYVDKATMKIVVFTRTGGGNREAYAEENQLMTQLPGYSHDEDDGFDSTYAKFYYDVRREDKDILVDVLRQQGGEYDPMTRFRQMMADFEAGKETPEVRRAREVGENLMRQITDFVKGDVKGNA